MSCREIRPLSVSDDAADRRRFRRHARECDECARILAGDRRLAAAAERWRQRTPAPPASLRERVRDAVLGDAHVGAETDDVATHGRAAVDIPADVGPRHGRRRWWLPPLVVAVAAALVLAVGLALLSTDGPAAVSTGGGLLLDEALAAAEAAEQEHARAIAELERAAEELLARAHDPSTPPREAALLMSYRHRLRSLDATIAEIRDYLDDNPGLPSARAVLLAAYRDKTDVLQELLARSEERGA